MDDGPALAFIFGADDPETIAEVRRRLVVWARSDGAMSLHQALGLRTPKRTREDARNRLLYEAAGKLPGTSWQRASALGERIRAFLVRRWPTWQDMPAPPPDAHPVDVLLWHCANIGAELELGDDRLWRITNITGAFRPKRTNKTAGDCVFIAGIDDQEAAP